MPAIPFPTPLVDINQGLALCKLLHEKLSSKGYFPALTGGLLYKDGSRKDIDIVIYRHRQDIDNFEMTDLIDLLSEMGVEVIECYGFVTKAVWNGFNVDLFNPETQMILYGGDY